MSMITNGCGHVVMDGLGCSNIPKIEAQLTAKDSLVANQGLIQHEGGRESTCTGHTHS